MGMGNKLTTIGGAMLAGLLMAGSAAPAWAQAPAAEDGQVGFKSQLTLDVKDQA